MLTKTLTHEAATLADDESYARASLNLAALQQKRAAGQKRQDEIEAALVSLGGGSNRDKIEAQARALVSGQSPDRQDDPAALRLQLGELRETNRILAAAISMQKEELASARDAASKIIAKALRPRHVVLVRGVAEALVALARAQDAEQTFRDILMQRDIAYCSSITPMVFHGPGRLSDEFSRVNAFLRECVSNGYLTVAEVDRLVQGGD